MNRILTTILAIALFAGCNQDTIEPPVDCNKSDLVFTVTITNTDCGLNNGILDIVAEGGKSPYNYSLDGGTSQTSSQFTGLAEGEYAVTVSDNNNCTVESTPIVASNNLLSVSASATNSECSTASGSIIIVAENGVEPYQYQLDDGLPQSSSEFPVGPGSYDITVIDVNGCEVVISQLVMSNTSYATDVQPIIANSCAIFGCHDGSNTSLPNYSNLGEIQVGASMIRSRTQSGNMPKTGSLTPEQIALIACWVDDGALNN